jgi:hypothetical protein
MAKKLILGALALAALWLGSGLVIRFFASDETKIRWLVETMEEAYNAGRPGTCVGPLAKGWRHEGHGVDRETLRGALFVVSRDRDRDTRELLSRVEVDEEALVIAVDGDRATLQADATFARRRGETWEPTWALAIEAELVDGEDGWEIVRSRHVDRSGTHLGR